ncbi:MAG: hypothetical protein HYX53_10685 [Chloroflexi bacterium]|nr:hypothetical protein [Chloroflexota bacterium]
MRERLHQLQEIVCIPCGAEPDDKFLFFWAGMHQACCLAGAFEILRIRRRVPGE